MLRVLVVLVFAFSAIGRAQVKRPVLVELFTSEGCSSCPPADALLEQLDKSQPVAGADIVVLSEHVDYWNHIGWRDPFSSPFYSARQSAYAGRFHLESVYTPQIVVDGAAEVLGSDQPAALHAIEQASRNEKLEIKLAKLPGGNLKIDISPSVRADGATVYLAVADSHASSEVRAGENKGRYLHHVAVVRSLTSIGKVTKQSGLSKELPLGKYAGNSRFIVFVQEANQGRVIGSAAEI